MNTWLADPAIKVYYMDTDCIITDSLMESSKFSGDMKLEDKYKEFSAIGPKLYGAIRT